MNRQVLPTMGVYLWRYRSMGPTSYDPDSLGTLVDRFARHGALTPNILVKLANTVLDVQIPSVNEDWGNVPFNYLLAAVQQGVILTDFEKMLTTIAGSKADNTPEPPAPVLSTGEPVKPKPGAKKALADGIMASGVGRPNSDVVALKAVANDLRAAAAEIIEKIEEARLYLQDAA
jgi:hypothetical protein